MEIPKILILSKEKPSNDIDKQFAKLLRIKTGDETSIDNFWKIKTKYYEASI